MAILVINPISSQNNIKLISIDFSLKIQRAADEGGVLLVERT
ncbi:Uncharacterised protein [Yersinia rohdei]|nr:Uncharacterised protein [Yersinia rohdei]